MKIAQVYRPGPAVCRPRDTLAAAADRMIAHGLDGLGVCAGGRLLGVVSERDLVRAVAEGADPRTAPVEGYVRWGAQAARVNEEAAVVARRMVELSVRRLPVLHDTQIVGMVALTDLLIGELRP